MIVTVQYGDDIVITVDDELRRQLTHPVRTSELRGHALALLTEVLAVRKAATTRTVRARKA